MQSHGSCTDVPWGTNQQGRAKRSPWGHRCGGNRARSSPRSSRSEHWHQELCCNAVPLVLGLAAAALSPALSVWVPLPSAPRSASLHPKAGKTDLGRRSEARCCFPTGNRRWRHRLPLGPFKHRPMSRSQQSREAPGSSRGCPITPKSSPNSF